MDRYKLHIIISIIVILVPIIGSLVAIWDMNRPQIGVYQPKPGPNAGQILLIVGSIGLGVTNLVVAIKRYKNNKKGSDD